MQVETSVEWMAERGMRAWVKQINYESENNVITWNPIDEHGASGTKGTKNEREARKCNWHFYNVVVTMER